MKTELIPKSRAKTAYTLLTEVRELILSEPLRYNQRDWLSRVEEHEGVCLFPKCGTVGCVAGWVATLKEGRSFDWAKSADLARPILGLSYDQGEELFNGGAVRGTSQTVEHAKAGAQHIAAFQKKYRAQLLAKKV